MDSSEYEEPTPCTFAERHKLTAVGQHAFPPYHRQSSTTFASKCGAPPPSSSSSQQHCRQSLLADFLRMPATTSTAAASSSSVLHCQGDSPSLLLCSSGSASAYATNALFHPPPQPPNFPPPKRRQRRLKGGERRRRKCALRLWLAAFLSLVGILLLPLLLWLTIFRSSQLSSPDDEQDYRISFHPSSSGALPDQLILNRPLRFRLPGHHLLSTHLLIAKDALLWLNFTLPPNARIVLFGRQTLRPSPGQFDWQRILTSNKLHLVTGENRLALVSHFLQAGKWHIGILNDRAEVESIGFVARLEEGGMAADVNGRATDGACKFDCFGKGECREGQCVCHPGYGGPFCGETSCPVLCSGQGVFSAGRCHCHDGFQGAECELTATGWCADPECGGHGQCQPDGTCACGPGWTGEECRERKCPGRGCSRHGICLDGKRCFCEPGWTGEDCGQRMMGGEMEREAERGDGHGWCPANCSGNGQCLEGKCQCAWGWTGEECARVVCQFGCAQHGQCQQDGRCQCAPGWTGQNCQIELCHQNCSNAGQCLLGADGWRCECEKGHFGSWCQFGWESNCEDGLDNDQDGLTDCEDSTECCATPACASNPLCLGPLLSADLLLHHAPLPPPSATFSDRFRFLFDGGDFSVQRYADQRLLEPKRLSIVRGRILSSRGGPLIGVRISDAHHAQQGFSLSRAGPESAGEFELAVNGGGTVILQFVRQPFGRLLRPFFVPFNQLLDIGPIWMDQQEGKEGDGGVHPPPPSSHCLAALGQLHFRPIIFTPRPSPSPSLPPSSHLARLALDSRLVSVSIPIRPGHSLLYSSDRANTSCSHLRVQLLGDEVPAQLLVVHLDIQIGGRRIERRMVPKARLEFQFAWDRQNAFWQREAGLVPGKVSIGLQFANCHRLIWHHSAFHLFSPPISTWALPSPLWSITSVHRLHPALALLERGDGQFQLFNDEVEEGETGWWMRTLLGANGGKRRRRGDQREGRTTMPPEDVLLSRPSALASAPDGSAYLGDADILWRIWPDGRMRTVDRVLQLDPKDSAHPYYLAVHPFTSVLHISLPLHRQIWRISSKEENGGGGEEYLMVSDETKGGLTFPKGIGFDLEGNLLVLDGRQLVQMDSQGAVHRVLVGADGSGWRPLRNCARLASLQELVLEWPTALSVDPATGQLFLLDSGSIVFRLDLRLGIVSVVVGAQRGCEGEAEGPIQAISYCPLRGLLFLAVSDGKRLNSVKSLQSAANHPPGPLQTIAGSQQKDNNICDCGDNQHCPCDDPEPLVEATQAKLNVPKALAALPNGDLLIADQGNAKLKRMEMARPEAEEGGIFRINSPATDEQFEFDAQGRHLRTRGWRSGMGQREMEYGENGELLAIREGGEEEMVAMIRVVRDEEGGWKMVDERRSMRELARAEVDGKGEREWVRKISSHVLLPHPALLDYGPGQLLKSVSIGPEVTSFRYDPTNGLASSVQMPGGGKEWTLDGPTLAKNGQWRTAVRRGNDAEWAEMLEGANGQLGLNRGGQALFHISSSSSSSPSSPRHLSIPVLSLHWHFDHSNPIRPWERVLTRQRLSIHPPGPSSGSIRAEWRVHFRRQAAAGKNVQLNGHNLFSIDFDQSKLADTIVDHFDNKLLQLEYSNGSRLKRVEWRNGAKLEIKKEQLVEMEGGGGKKEEEEIEMRKFKLGKWEWTERRDAEGKAAEQFVVNEKGERAYWRRLRRSMDGKEVEVILPSNATFKWSTSGADGATILLSSPSGERHLLVQFVPIFHREITHLGVHCVRGPNEENRPKLRWTEGRDGMEGGWKVKRSGENWVERRAGEWGQLVEQQQTNGTLAIQFGVDPAGRAISAKSALFHRQHAFMGPFPVSINSTLHFASSSSSSFLFNWTRADQLFWPSAFGLHLGDTEGCTNWTRMEFVEGQKGREGNFRFEHGPDRLTIIGRGDHLIDMFRAEFFLDHLGRPILRKYFFPANAPEPSMVVSFDHDPLGGWKSEQWSTLDGRTQWTGAREFNEDGQVIFQRVGMAGNEWRIGYDRDLRPNQLNGIRLRFGPGGVPIRFGEIAYETEEGSGWVRKRGSTTFQYDGLGQPILFMEGQKQIDYVYDEMGRLIGRRGAEEEDAWLLIHYADPVRPMLPTHFWKSSRGSSPVIWRIYWTDAEEPFFLESSAGQKFVLVPDTEKSVRLLLDMGGSIVQEMSYSPMGGRFPPSPPPTTAPSGTPPFPLGFRSQFYDAEAHLLLFTPCDHFPASRPFDTLIGRFMTRHYGLAESFLEWLRPELLFDPFGMRTAAILPDAGQFLAHSLANLWPKPAFAKWTKSPLGLPPTIPTGLGLSLPERLSAEVGNFERITSLDATAQWNAEIWAPSWMPRERENVAEFLVLRNGTKIGFKFLPGIGEKLELFLKELLREVELENVALAKLLEEVGEEEGRPILHLAKERKMFGKDKQIVEEYMATGAEGADEGERKSCATQIEINTANMLIRIRLCSASPQQMIAIGYIL